MERRVEELEVKVAYLESTLEDLNQVVIKQQLEQGAEFVRPLSEETPPPHY